MLPALHEAPQTGLVSLSAIYEGFLEALRDPTHEEHQAMLAWVGGKFDPEAFDLGKVNRQLRRLKRV